MIILLSLAHYSQKFLKKFPLFIQSIVRERVARESLESQTVDMKHVHNNSTQFEFSWVLFIPLKRTDTLIFYIRKIQTDTLIFYIRKLRFSLIFVNSNYLIEVWRSN